MTGLVSALVLLFALLRFHLILAILDVRTDSDGNTIVSVPNSLCFKPGGGDGGEDGGGPSNTDLLAVVNAMADCSKQGKGYDRILKKCTEPPGQGSIPSSAVVANPAALGDRPYRLSLLYCYWSGSAFTSCAGAQHSYNGNANFRTSSAVVSGARLAIPFHSAYFKEPMCSITFENVVAFSLVDTRTNEVVIQLRDPNGSNKNWSSAATWMFVICHGAM